jgi:hypothetical protein
MLNPLLFWLIPCYVFEPSRKSQPIIVVVSTFVLQLGIYLLLMAQNMEWIWSMELCYYTMIVYHYNLITPKAMTHLVRTKILREIEQIENLSAAE